MLTVRRTVQVSKCNIYSERILYIFYIQCETLVLAKMYWENVLEDVCTIRRDGEHGSAGEEQQQQNKHTLKNNNK